MNILSNPAAKLIEFIFLTLSMLTIVSAETVNAQNLSEVKNKFVSPPDDARPGVYWYFLDGNISRNSITEDLESMKKAGIGSVLFLEVNLGVPRGKIDFLSPEWQDLFKHITSECERLGIAISLGLGPGWCGSGGPWVKPEESMRHLVSSSVTVEGGNVKSIVLHQPVPRKPYFGEDVFTPTLKKQWNDYYKDEFVLAFPATDSSYKIANIDRKALYYRDPYTSMPGTPPFLPEPYSFNPLPAGQVIDKNKIIDISKLLQPDGSITWQVPPGKWTITRFGMRNNGAVTRPAPLPGLGFECDKFDTAAFQHHFDNFIGKIITPNKNLTGGIKTLHMDSWEMGAQNWSDQFRSEFINRRGYDPLPYLPVFNGFVVGSLLLSERFLWDVRVTAEELVFQNHALYVKKLAHQYGLNFSIEPYDMNPCADLDLGAIADVPAGEFWNKGNGFVSDFSCIEAASIAHILGKPVVMSESFTTDWNRDPYICYPTVLKNRGDWAFCAGVNHFFYHTFAHKAWLGDQYLPGMSMGGFGVHWDRGQTWWYMSDSYHKYITRCSYLLQQGGPVADILYLTPEGAPQVFRAPPSAFIGNSDSMPDRKGYNFDGCSPDMLIKNAGVKDGKIVFKSGATYQVLVMPSNKTMTPQLLKKIESLVTDGATIIGNPPMQSPSLSNYPDCDNEVRKISEKMWESFSVPISVTKRHYGKGSIYWGGMMSVTEDKSLYPAYQATEKVLKEMKIIEDFVSQEDIRYTHRQFPDFNIWFVSNKTNKSLQTNCTFRSDKGSIEIWDPVTGEFSPVHQFVKNPGTVTITINFAEYQSYFVVFDNHGKAEKSIQSIEGINKESSILLSINGPWEVSFDPKWGGPEKIIFTSLDDWTKRTEEGIKYYSGTAFYRTKFEYSSNQTDGPIYLALGDVYNMARVYLNGQDLGEVWTAPWQVNIANALHKGVNKLEIEVVNLWPNRIIGDEKKPYDGVKDGQWPSWLLNGTERPSGRYTFTIWTLYQTNAPLLKSGLLGPVTLIKGNKNAWK